MALEAAFLTLCQHYQHFHDTLEGLRLTVVEDKPLTGDVALIDQLGNAIDDLMGWLEDAFAAANAGWQAVQHPVDCDRARRSLAVSQEQYAKLIQRLTTDLLSYDRVAAVLELGNERGGEWQSWANSVKESLEGCQQHVYDIQHALFLCWQELAERTDCYSRRRKQTSAEMED